ncbi:protocadherin-15-like isoform X2 [Strongylocentrotus purpuratus]|uniref:Cadherin domain-containing protein n=1 Tax=Strongylocentrotus purpuratus TaxID=7668 RepID=A0A7M7SW36_STRPU|nr:protocadherin-15-like isoform X2 [Strongylocentrotus purpuratus]
MKEVQFNCHNNFFCSFVYLFSSHRFYNASLKRIGGKNNRRDCEKRGHVTMTRRENLLCSCVCSQCHGGRFSAPPNERPDPFRRRTEVGLSPANCRFTRTLFTKMATHQRLQGLKLHVLVLLAVLTFIGPTPTQAFDRQKRQIPGIGQECQRSDGLNTDPVIEFEISESNPAGTSIGFLPITGITGSSGSITLVVTQDNPSIFINVLTKQLMLVQTVDADPPNAVKSISLTVQCQTLINFNYDILIKVNDANDNTPFFIGAPYTVSVSEATAINEVIFAGIEADDNDGDNRNGQISFEIVPNQNDPMSNSYFDMPNTGKGEVTLLQSLDFETRQQWTVSIVAKDRGVVPRSSMATLTVTVLNADDQAPMFVGCNTTICTNVEYRASVLEKTPRLGPLQFSPNQIRVVNSSGGTVDPQSVTFSFTGGQPPQYSSFFSINPTTGQVNLLQQVRRSEYDVFSISVAATKGSSSSTATVIIEVTPINNFQPTFPNTTMTGYISENVIAGTRVTADSNGIVPLLIQATDPDLDQDEDPGLSYLLDDNSVFTLDLVGTNGVYLSYSGLSNTPLDAETQASYNVSIIARPTNTSGQFDASQQLPTLQVTILIRDLNDNSPEFQQNQYFDPVTNQYTVNLKDNAAFNTEVISIPVTDADATSLPPIIDHTFVSLPAIALFSVVQQNSDVIIRLISEGSLVIGSEYIIQLRASDSQAPQDLNKQSNVYVRIIIISGVNNRPPMFDQTSYSTSADENLPFNALVDTVRATDPDGEFITYSITSGNINNAFMTVDGANNGEIRVQGSLDREVLASYSLVVEASDGNLTASAVVLITINDVNDEPPVFSGADTFLILESISNELVGQVQATDQDQLNSANSAIIYSFLPEVPEFRIEPTTGRIFTTVGLDREQQDIYTLTVMARDTTTNPLSATLDIVIVVQDTNDNRPVFESAEYIIEVPENTPLQGFFAVQALDRDANAPLRYAITAGETNIFSIDPLTGNLSLLVPLDYENIGARSFYFEVTVTDVDGVNLTDVANITIVVTDVNDNIPSFEKTQYDVIALREYQIGDIVLANITVTDGDPAGSPNSELTFRFLPPSDLFEFTDPTQGNVYVIGDISNTTMWHNLTIVVSDGGDPANIAMVPLSILLRVEKPIFPENVIIVDDVMEEEEPGVVVAVIEAMANIGDVILYTIVNSTDPSAFTMNTTDNVATIYTNMTLDRELVENYSISVQANIQGATPDENNLPEQTGRRKRRQADLFSEVAEPTDPNVVYIYVNVADINDNGPYFLKENYYAGVSTVARVGTQVIAVEAFDDDEGENGVSTYSIVAVVQGEPLFRIDRATGIFSTTQSLEGEEAGSQFEYTVLAEDPNNNFTIAETMVKISLIDNSHRAILAGNIDPDLMRENQDALSEILSEALTADVYIEDVSQREVGNGLDPTGSDVLFYALDANGDPILGNDMVEILLSQNTSLNERYSTIVENKTITDIRRPTQPTTGPGVSPDGNGPTVEAIALICLACVLFICVVIAIGVVIISWKKREMEKDKAGRMYLPSMYNTFNPYGNGEDLEISNPVYYEDQSNQA